MQIEKGEFVCVVGDVGAGKSSLLHAIIGDMIYIPSADVEEIGYDEPVKTETMNTLRKKVLNPEFSPPEAPITQRGDLAYVEQSPWIQNKTIRENILFGRPLDHDRYVNTIIACQLERDLEILPAGDTTEIGEKGINLSGGQKARISLARAVYSEAEVVVMDDPISALDANVKKKIFKHVF